MPADDLTTRARAVVHMSESNAAVRSILRDGIPKTLRHWGRAITNSAVARLVAAGALTTKRETTALYDECRRLLTEGSATDAR